MTLVAAFEACLVWGVAHMLEDLDHFENHGASNQDKIEWDLHLCALETNKHLHIEWGP